MVTTIKYRIYPNKEQEIFLFKEIGLCRLYHNLAVAAKKEDIKSPIESYKKTFEKYRPDALEYAKEVDSTALAEEWNYIGAAFSNYFASRKGKRKGKPIGFPKFKSRKNDRQSVGYTNAINIKFINGKLLVTRKMGPLNGRFHRFINGKIKKCSIIYNKTGKWYICLTVNQKPVEKNHNGKIVGIDWNCRDDAFLTFSDGTKVKCPRLLKKRLVRLGRKQQALSHCMKQSKNYEKKRINVAKLHEKISNQRNDFLHKLSRSIVDNYEYVVVEDINLQKMASKLHHGKVIGDQGFGMLRSMIEYKGTLIKVPAPYTSKTCSACGEINENVVVGIEKWTCPNCGCYHDRDINAAKNIERLGRKVLGEPEDFKPVESKVTETTKQEVSSSCMDNKGHTKTRRRRGL